MITRQLLSILSGCLLALGLLPTPTWRTAQADGSAQALVKQLKSGDDEIAAAAVDALIRLGPHVALEVTAFLQKEDGCMPRLLATRVLHRFDPSNPLIVSTLASVTNGVCYFNPRRDIAVRRDAGMALAQFPTGVEELARMLRKERTFNRQTAAFAFDELSERLAGRMPEIEATPEMVAKVEAAIPALRDALGDDDEVVRCMSFEALEQFGRSSVERIQIAARAALRGAAPKCDA